MNNTKQQALPAIINYVLISTSLSICWIAVYFSTIPSSLKFGLYTSFYSNLMKNKKFISGSSVALEKSTREAGCKALTFPKAGGAFLAILYVLWKPFGNVVVSSTRLTSSTKRWSIIQLHTINQNISAQNKLPN